MVSFAEVMLLIHIAKEGVQKGMYSKEQMSEKMKGLKALAERGVAGEKEAAQKMLDKLMEKYGISENDIAEEAVELAWFRYQSELEERLIMQIIYMVLGDCDMYRERGKGNRKLKVLGAYCNAAERLEIELNFDFFSKALKEELDIFYKAFANKNKLFPKEGKEREARPEDELSKAELLKLALMMEGMDRRTMTKMIECN
jgi:hypothetical protein